ncbi:hypothetical protein V2J09_021961 [Rumex salicifolius]
MDLPNGYYVVRFETEKDHSNALTSMQINHYVVLRGGGKAIAAIARHLRNHRVSEHVDAQCGGGGDDDAGGDGDPTAVARGRGPIGGAEQVLQGGGVGGDILGGGGRDEHTNGDKCQPNIGGDVEELLPGGQPLTLGSSLPFPRASHLRVHCLHQRKELMKHMKLNRNKDTQPPPDNMNVEVASPTPPPQKPPDPPRTWKDMVVGDTGQRRPALSDEFLHGKIKVEFPEADNFEPSVTIAPEVLQALVDVWKSSVIVKPLGKFVPFHIIERNWSPSFNPYQDVITSSSAWVRINNLPFLFNEEGVLMREAAGIGVPIKVDMKTLFTSKGRYDRVCVELDLTKPLKGTIRIEGVKYILDFEGLNLM